MLQDPGKAHNGPWKVDYRAYQQFDVHNCRELRLLMWLCCFVFALSGQGAFRSSVACGESRLVHSWPNVCWLRRRIWLRVARPSLDAAGSLRQLD